MGDFDLPGVRELRRVVGWPSEPAAFELLRGVREARWAVAETSGEVVGMVGAVPLGEVGVLCHLAVRSEYRGAGIGRGLSLWAKAYLRSCGVKTVRLYSTDFAAGLYRSLGFEAVGRRVIYRNQGDVRALRSTGTGVREMSMGDLPEVIGQDL